MKAMTSEAKTATEKKQNSPKNGGIRINEKTQELAILGLLTAIVFLMSFTPLGYLKVGPLSLTFLTVPVIVAAAILKPTDAAIIGGMFGITSFIQAVTGASALTGALFQLNPFLTFLLCVVPRVLEGLIGGLIFQGLKSVDKTKFISYLVTSISVPVLNTILFMSALYAEVKIVMMDVSTASSLTGDFAKTFAGISSKAGGDLFTFFFALVGVQALIEAGVCFVLGTSITKALAVALKKDKK